MDRCCTTSVARVGQSQAAGSEAASICQQCGVPQSQPKYCRAAVVRGRDMMEASAEACALCPGGQCHQPAVPRLMAVDPVRHVVALPDCHHSAARERDCQLIHLCCSAPRYGAGSQAVSNQPKRARQWDCVHTVIPCLHSADPAHAAFSRRQAMCLSWIGTPLWRAVADHVFGACILQSDRPSYHRGELGKGLHI